MNKTTKGAIAAASAALLLAGGAGTMASWNASTTAGGAQTVTAGSLKVAQVGTTGTWTWGDGTTAFNPASDKIVPGDVIKFTAQYKIDLVGTNIKATLAPALGGVSGDLPLVATPATGQQTAFTAGLNQLVTYTTTITFPKGAVVDNTSQEKTASLAGSSVTLEQTITP